MIDAQQLEPPRTTEPSGYSRPAGPRENPPKTPVREAAKCDPMSDDEVVVCGRRDDEQFRLRPLRPPPGVKGVLSRPLRVQIAPGVSFGFQDRGGLGVRVEFGPGAKSGTSERGERESQDVIVPDEK